MKRSYLSIAYISMTLQLFIISSLKSTVGQQHWCWAKFVDKHWGVFIILLGHKNGIRRLSDIALIHPSSIPNIIDSVLKRIDRCFVTLPSISSQWDFETCKSKAKSTQVRGQGQGAWPNILCGKCASKDSSLTFLLFRGFSSTIHITQFSKEFETSFLMKKYQTNN